MKTKKCIFLVDSGGAVLSAIVLIIVIRYQELIGMPEKILQLMLPIPIIFSVLSFLFFHCTKKNWRNRLKFMALLNFCYCVLTLILCLVQFSTLTKLGLSYFGLEMLIIGILAISEFKIANDNGVVKKRG